MAFETYFECKACKISIPISKSKESKYFNGDKKRRHSMIEYESNIEPLLASNYMGCGPEEVAFLLASLNIDDVENFRSWYYRYSDFLGKPIRELTKDLIMEARDEEIRETFVKTL